MRATQWSVPGAMRWDYSYTNFGENTGRVTYAKNLDDGTLDRSYDYDNVGRMWASHSGKEARWHIGLEGYSGADGPYAFNAAYDQWGNITQRNGWGVANASYTASYSNNRRVGFSYDASGNLTNDGSQTFTYDATGQQATASGNSLTQNYDGDGLRAKKVENGTTTYYLRSSVLGGQVVSELNGSGTWIRGYVYLGGQLVAIQSNLAVSTVHQDPVTKSQRITDSSGNLTSTIVDLDPWGGETGRSSNQAFQPHRFTSYERDANSGDDAMMRRYQSSSSRFNQPDPYGGSYDLTDPQSLNRYTYTQNDPVNFVDPSGLLRIQDCTRDWWYGADGVLHYSSWRCTTIYDDGGGQTSVEVPLPDVDAGVRALLNNPTCAAFVTNLLNAVQSNANPAQTTSGLGLVSMISRYVLEPQTSGGRPIGGTIGGYVNENNATIYISPTTVSSLAGPGVRQEAQLGYVMVALHEMFHHGGQTQRYSDVELAQAAYSIARPDLGLIPPDPKNYPNGVGLGDASSRYWNDVLNAYCRPAGTR